MDEKLENQEVTPEETSKGETPEQGTVSTDTEDTTKVETEPKEEMVSKAELEKLQKEKEQVEIRKNQLENELEKAKKSAEKAGNDELVEQLQAELDELKSEKEREQLEKQVQEFETEMAEVFDKVASEYPEEVQVVAKFNKDKIGISAIVGEVQYGFQAEKNIKDYFDGLQEGFKAISKPEIKVDATNPSITPTQSEKDLIEAELIKPEKDRDYSKILSKRLGKRM